MKVVVELTFPPKNVRLAERFSSDKENADDKDDESALHARIQARGRAVVEGGQSIAAAERTLGVVEQALFNWVKTKREGKLSGVDSKAVSAEQMEISRLRAELAPVKMERDILQKATAYFAKRSCEVRRRLTPPTRVADLRAMPGAANQFGGIHEHFVRKASQNRKDGQRHHLSDDALLVHIKAIHAETRGG